MTKIKNYRVQLRAREMVRWLKREKNLDISPDLELSVEQLIKSSTSWIRPAALYTTLTRQTAEKTLSAMEFPKGSVAVSVVAVSIGPGLSAERQTCVDPSRAVLLEALESEAQAQALQFAIKLIQDQAEEEECEMSTPLTVTDESLMRTLSSLLGVSRIGIDLSAEGASLPSFLRVCYCFWAPTKKSSSRRAPDSKRVEKVAA